MCDSVSTFVWLWVHSGAGPVGEEAISNNPNDVTILWRAGYALNGFNSGNQEKQALGRECVERAARSDTVVGRVAQAYRIMQGWGRHEDEPGAARLLGELVATTASPDAQHLLGVCYYDGWGVQQSAPEAVRLWTLAAEQGHASAQYALGCCYYERDEVKAKKLWQMAASQGHPKAATSLIWVPPTVGSLQNW